MARYPNFKPLLSNWDLPIILSGFMGGFQGIGDAGATPSAANYWWGGGTGTGTGLMVPADDTNTNNTQHGDRQGLMKDLTTAYWYYQNTGNASQEQRIIDEMIDMMADAGVTVINPLYYMRTSEIPDRNGVPFSEKIYHWFDYYLSSSRKSRLKFTLMAISKYASFDSTSATVVPIAVGSWNNLPTMAAYWASLMLDPQYYYSTDGKPIMYLYNDTNAWDAGKVATITTACTNAGVPTPYYLNPQGNTTAVNGVLAYGPNSGLLPGAGQNAYKARTDLDVAFDQTHGGIARQMGFQMFDDSRPINGTRWTDNPTYSEAEAHLKRRMQYARSVRQLGDTFKGVYGYAAGEIAEGGAFFPTRQSISRGVNTPSRGVWLDAIYNVKRGIFPSTYTDCYHAESKHACIVRTGSWATTMGVTNGGGANPAAFRFREHRASAAATLTITPTQNVTRIRVYGRKGPGFGHFGAQTDLGGSTDVDQSAGSDSFNQLLYDTGALAAGSHNVKITWTSGTISLDEFKVDVSR